MFLKYPKIHRLGKEETEGVLNGICIIQEKVDGANVSIYIEGGRLVLASRNHEIQDDFNGFRQHIESNPNIFKFLIGNSTYRLYGEWLVRHSISYSETAYKKVYLFDVWDDENNCFLPQENVDHIAKELGLEYPEVFDTVENPSIEDIKKWVGQTHLGIKGEGVVIKNESFMNKFGDCVYAKLVTEEFKESNAVIFGGNNKHSDSYYEVYVMNKYITLGRVQKILHKLEPELNERLDLKHIPRITSMVYHDMVTEDMWEIIKKVPKLDFKTLQRVCYKKIIQIYKDILADDLPITYKINE